MTKQQVRKCNTLTWIMEKTEVGNCSDILTDKKHCKRLETCEKFHGKRVILISHDPCALRCQTFVTHDKENWKNACTRNYLHIRYIVGLACHLQQKSQFLFWIIARKYAKIMSCIFIHPAVTHGWAHLTHEASIDAANAPMVVEGLTMVFYIKNLRHPETNSKQHTFKKQDETRDSWDDMDDVDFEHVAKIVSSVCCHRRGIIRLGQLAAWLEPHSAPTASWTTNVFSNRFAKHVEICKIKNILQNLGETPWKSVKWNSIPGKNETHGPWPSHHKTGHKGLASSDHMIRTSSPYQLPLETKNSGCKMQAFARF